MIDAELLTRRMVLITADLEALQPLAAKPLDEYLASATDELVAERLLERIIGRMIDVNYHVLIESGLPPPRDYYDSFTDLVKIRLLPSEFAVRIAACAGLRNRIAHEYDTIDPARVHAAIQTAVLEIPEYLRSVQTFVAR